MEHLQTFAYVRLKIGAMPKKSKVWLHFIMMDRNKAKYNICAKDIMAKDGNPTEILIWITR